MRGGGCEQATTSYDAGYGCYSPDVTRGKDGEVMRGNVGGKEWQCERQRERQRVAMVAAMGAAMRAATCGWQCVGGNVRAAMWEATKVATCGRIDGQRGRRGEARAGDTAVDEGMVRLEETRKNEKTRRIIVGERARLEKRGQDKRSEWETGARGFGGGRGMGGCRSGTGPGQEKW